MYMYTFVCHLRNSDLIRFDNVMCTCDFC